MISLQRPSPPPGFPSPDLQSAQAALHADPDSLDRKKLQKHWQAHKAALLEAQHHKCFWCETRLGTACVGDVDHYAPMGAVAEQVSSAPINRYAQRRRRNLHSRGYWWRALDWDNWLVSCSICNQTCKGALFPVAESPHPPPDPQQSYTPLLLDAWSDHPKISDHLTFDDLGQICAVNGSARGQATIETCGLDREKLREARLAVIRRLEEDLEMLAVATDPRSQNILQERIRTALGPHSEYSAAARAKRERLVQSVAAP